MPSDACSTDQMTLIFVWFIEMRAGFDSGCDQFGVPFEKKKWLSVLIMDTYAVTSVRLRVADVYGNHQTLKQPGRQRVTKTEQKSRHVNNNQPNQQTHTPTTQQTNSA